MQVQNHDTGKWIIIKTHPKSKSCAMLNMVYWGMKVQRPTAVQGDYYSAMWIFFLTIVATTPIWLILLVCGSLLLIYFHVVAEIHSEQESNDVLASNKKSANLKVRMFVLMGAHPTGSGVGERTFTVRVRVDNEWKVCSSKYSLSKTVLPDSPKGKRVLSDTNVSGTLCSCRAWELLYSCEFPTMWK
jgi:hypothetical protein